MKVPADSNDAGFLIEVMVMAIYSKDAIVKAGNVILIVKDVKEHVSA